ncbi:PepSY domain-containing protein [Massilia arenosa]|uniref:PepSY domain-containing protein n=1 Tax=Zemynaea arenosa TaxID=2561931 RepID=A0A4Y9SCS3_9BURK|nr:PepSY-associated TM helix domain-containing protein [Massilia arenosa]TFW17595.1 PepSY domain-containing protein [Massilia arenosa]
MVTGSARTLLRRVHLWIALVFGVVLSLSGVTGAALAWIHELDAALNPTLFHVPVRAQAQVAPERVRALVAMLEARPGYGRPTQLSLPEAADEPVVAWYRQGGAKSPWKVEVSRQVMVDPATLAIAGERNWGEAGLSRPLLMPTLFHVHRYLLSGDVGKTVIGAHGIALFLLGAIGVALWWPVPTWKGLRQALTVSYRGSWRRFNFSAHRAIGFVAAPLLMFMGFSGVYFNLPEVVVPVVKAVAQVTPADKLKNEAAQGRAPIAVDAALRAVQERLPQARLSRVILPAKPSVPYEVRARQPGEVRQGDGNTRVTVDAYSGRILRLRDPLHAPGGDGFFNWLFPLHTGEVLGNAGRVAISILGLTPLFFMVTGTWLWLQRRRPAPAPTHGV